MAGDDETAALGYRDRMSPAQVADVLRQQFDLRFRMLVRIARVGLQFLDGNQLLELAPDFDAGGDGFCFGGGFSGGFAHAS